MSLPVLVAIDTKDQKHAEELMYTLSGKVAGFKVGLEYFCKYGSVGVKHLVHKVSAGSKLFLDLKLNDIGNTVSGAIESVLENVAPYFLSIHINAGTATLTSAVKTIRSKNIATKLIGISVLTSIDDNDALRLYDDNSSMKHRVLRLAEYGMDAGINGVVCSPQEVGDLHDILSQETILIVPGVRLLTSSSDDQKRVGTPKQALADGASYVVIGRHLNQHRSEKDILAALAELSDHLNS